MLLGEQLGRCHQRHLASTASGARSGGSGHHRLATAHIALQQPDHGPHQQQVRLHFRECAALRTGQRERQGGGEAGAQPVGILKSPGLFAARLAFHPAQTQLMREQLLEGQPPLRRVAT